MTVATSAPIAPEVSVTPTVSPGFRLVPARIGTWSRSQIAYIQCPTWCREDHAADPEALEDITHYGDLSAGLTVKSFLNGDTALYCWWARVESDPGSSDARMRATHVLVGDDSAEEARMMPDAADAFADDLVAFAEQVRDLARIARAANRLAA
jgi:hypothetical protein